MCGRRRESLPLPLPSKEGDGALFWDLAAVGVGGGGVEFLLQLLADVVADEVLDAVGWFVDVVERHAELLHEIRLPEAVGADELAGGFAAGGGEVEVVAAASDAAVAQQIAEAESGEPTAADGGLGFGGGEAALAAEFFDAIKHREQVFADDAKRDAEVAGQRADDAMLRGEEDGEAE
jgi:hypothetical protein